MMGHSMLKLSGFHVSTSGKTRSIGIAGRAVLCDTEQVHDRLFD